VAELLTDETSSRAVKHRGEEKGAAACCHSH